MERDTLPRPFAALAEEGVDNGLIGGVAVNLIEAMTREVQGVPVRLATPAALYRLTRDTVRPIDAQDAEHLRHAFAFEEDD